MLRILSAALQAGKKGVDEAFQIVLTFAAVLGDLIFQTFIQFPQYRPEVSHQFLVRHQIVLAVHQKMVQISHGDALLDLDTFGLADALQCCAKGAYAAVQKGCLVIGVLLGVARRDGDDFQLVGIREFL